MSSLVLQLSKCPNWAGAPESGCQLFSYFEQKLLAFLLRETIEMPANAGKAETKREIFQVI